jgi:hypothetical protein
MFYRLKILNSALLIIFMFSAPNIFGQLAPKYSNEFLSLGIGARNLGMGNSTVSSSKDVTAIYWNPASLAEIDKKFDIGLMHSEYFAGIAKYDFIGINYKIDLKSSIALSMIRFGVDDIPNTLDLFDSYGNIHYDRISSFSASDYAFIGSYSRKVFVEGLSIGANVKLIRRKAGDFAGAWGFGFDVAAKYNYKNWKFGVNIKDITSTFNAWQYNQSQLRDIFIITGNTVPQNGLELTLPKILLGTAYLFNIKDKVSIMPEICLPITTDGKRNTLIKSNAISIDPSMGLEIGYVNLVFIRAGVNNFQTITDIDGEEHFSCQPNIGVGLKYKWFSVDYAFTNIGNQGVSLYSHVFSLGISFDTKKKESASRY